MGVMKIWNIVPRAGLATTSLVFQASVLPLSHVGCLISPLYPQLAVYAAPCLRSLQITTLPSLIAVRRINVADGTLFCFVCLFIALRHSNGISGHMMYEMRRIDPKPTPWPTQGTFNLAHHIGMVWEELTLNDVVNYTKWGNGLQPS